MSLLQTRVKILEPRPWLYRVCHNMLCAHYQTRHGESDLQMRLQTEAEYSEYASLDEESGPACDPDLSDIPSLAETAEYQALQEICAYRRLGDYAEAKGISLARAKQLSKQLKKDLKARYLRYLGWENSVDILEYNQYKAIQRYIRQLVDCVSSKGTASRRKNSFLPSREDLDRCFSGLVATQDWNIHQVGPDTYDIFLVCLDREDIPVLIKNLIRIKANRRIETLSCLRLEPTVSFDVGDEVDLPLEKGMCSLSEEEVVAFLQEQQALKDRSERPVYPDDSPSKITIGASASRNRSPKKSKPTL
jgi:hypothetical protein